MKKYILFILPEVLALLTSLMMIGQPASVQGGPSACPDPGQCTCNPATDVMTDHAMSLPLVLHICS